jgi:putative Mg2+ transporter-C (MgtC) family protein
MTVLMHPNNGLIVLHLLGALIAGSLIGLERSYHGRAAGFRTHALVALASSMLMLLTAFQSQWLTTIPSEALRADPTRMAQGIMTGIGFLGAGVIYKEGLSVRGLTTAGSIWITAAIGILFGVGFYFPAILATLLALLILSVFRYIEIRIPSETFFHLVIGFERSAAMPENELNQFLNKMGFSIVSQTYSMKPATGATTASYVYTMVVRTYDAKNNAKLAQALLQLERVVTFEMDPQTT